MISDNSDSDYNSLQSTKKIRKKTKTVRPKITKTISENKSKN